MLSNSKKRINIWNITQTADGVIETLNPNDPMVMAALQQELNKQNEKRVKPSISGSEKLVMILKLLQSRIKAEALFPNDEKGQNLRVLAYCLQSQTEKEWKKLILEYFGSSLGVRYCLDLFYMLSTDGFLILWSSNVHSV